MAGRHRRRRRAFQAALALAVLMLALAVFAIATSRVEALSDFNWVHDAPAATIALPGQGA
jgi:hypothetical protein